MNEQEMINVIGTLFVQHWSYFVGGLITFLTGFAFLTWRIANGFHHREKKLLQSELEHQKDRFSQYESIVEQRISLLQSEAELLSKKINPKENIVLYQGAIKEGELTNLDADNRAMFMRDLNKANEGIKSFLDKTEVINSVLKSLVHVI